jgi:hypothetical protein
MWNSSKLGQMHTKTDIVGIHRQIMGKIGGLSPAYQGLLLVFVVLCALSVVTSQHKARKLYIELQKEKERALQMDVEWGQLQLSPFHIHLLRVFFFLLQLVEQLVRLVLRGDHTQRAQHHRYKQQALVGRAERTDFSHDLFAITYNIGLHVCLI